MLIGFTMSLSIIEKAWERFQLNPTFTSIIINDEDTRLTYPTVDVCPYMAIDMVKIINLLGREPNVSKSAGITDIIKNFYHLSANDMKSISRAMNTNDLRVLAFNLAAKCTDLFANCKFKGKPIDCCTKFLPVLSEHGICFSFNARVFGSSLSE